MPPLVALAATVVVACLGLTRRRAALPRPTFDDELPEVVLPVNGGREPEHYWVYPDRLVAGPWPSALALDWLEAQGVGLIVNLTEDPYADGRFEIHQISIVDGRAPHARQIAVFCRLVEEALASGRKAYIHCLGGYGRTGTMVACLRVYRDRMGWMDAIRWVRSHRRGSVEVTDQEEAVAEWEALMVQTGHTLDIGPSSRRAR